MECVKEKRIIATNTPNYEKVNKVMMNILSNKYGVQIKADIKKKTA